MGASYVALVYLSVVVVATMLLTLYVGARLFHAIGKVRSDSRRAVETSRRMQQEWEEFNRNQSELMRRKLAAVDERAAALEQNTASRISDFSSQVDATRHELQRLEQYLRDVFEVELKNVFDSFDSTVGGVLEEMKAELMRGVDRIEQIQTVMEERNACEGQLTDSRETVRGLSSAEEEEEPAEGQTEAEEPDETGESEEKSPTEDV